MSSRPTVQHEGTLWRFTTNRPSEQWSKATFDDALWSSGNAGFGATTFTNAPIRTTWETGELWLRREISLPSNKLNFPALRLSHGQEVEVFLNGVSALKLSGRSPKYDEFDIKPEAAKTLKRGLNQIAVHCWGGKTAQFFDMELVQESAR